MIIERSFCSARLLPPEIIALIFTALTWLPVDAAERPDFAALHKQGALIEQKLAQAKLTQADIATVKVADSVVIFRRFKGFADPSLIVCIVSGIQQDPNGESTIYVDSAQSPPIKDGLVLTLSGKLVGQIVGDGKRIQVRPAVANAK